MKKISQKELIQNLLELKEKLGRVPKKEDIQLKNGSKYSFGAYYRAFGSVNKALLLANLKPGFNKNLNKDEIIQNIKDIYDILQKTPTFKEYVKYGGKYKSYATIQKHFGSWTAALMSANIPVSRVHAANKEMITEELSQWYLKNCCNSNCLSYEAIKKAKRDQRFLLGPLTIKKYFPNLSWQQIMQKIDVFYETNERFCKDCYMGQDEKKYCSIVDSHIADHLYELKKQKKIIQYEYQQNVSKMVCKFFIIVKNNEKVWLDVDSMKSPIRQAAAKKIFCEKNNIKYKTFSYLNKNIKDSINWSLNIGKTYVINEKEFNHGEITDEFIFFTKEEIYNLHMKHGENYVLENILVPFYNFVLQYIEENGWIYANRPTNGNYVLQQIKERAGQLNSSSRIGGQFMKGYFKSFWHCSVGKEKKTTDIIYDREVMMVLLKYIFGINKGKKYNYFFNGENVQFQELSDISIRRVRRSLALNRYVVSLFKPLVAKYIYQKYGHENITVWDPCAGFGGRMLGFLGSFDSATYIGNEPNAQTFGELKELSKELSSQNKIILNNSSIENAEIPKVDMVFTCTPYDFKEHYCDDSNQSDNLYYTYEDWVNGFLYSILKKSYLSLKQGGKCILIFDQKNVETCIDISKKVGFALGDSFLIENNITHLNPSVNCETVLVFKKGGE